MSVQIYNTLTKKKEELPEGNIKMYTCGVTVYDVCHIGHARSLYVFDIMVRYLKYRGYKVKFVRNITDIDDKIIKKANELGLNAKEVADKYIQSYKRDLKSLGIEEIEHEPRATENIPEMIRHIQALIEKGFAYEVDGDVYFSVRKFSGYGKLSGQSIEQMQEAVRIEKDPKKKDPLDFALWKKTEEDETFTPYESPWGKGRPGWHIECSVMSSKFLKTETLDIHGGGRDLIFPHHENEIAQSEALTGKPFAKFWIHHGLLTINGQKMAKSLGNFITIKDFIDKYKNPNILKLFFLSTHYSNPIDYTDGKIEEAKKTNTKLLEMLKKVEKIIKNAPAGEMDKIKKKSVNGFKFIMGHFEEAMDDDLNTPKALAVLQNLITETNTAIIKYPQLLAHDTSWQQLYYSCYVLLPKIAEIFGLTLDLPKDSLSEEEELLLKEREESRVKKDFRRSDGLRERLKHKGIVVDDTKDGQAWRRI